MESYSQLRHSEHIAGIQSSGVIIGDDRNVFEDNIGQDRVYPYLIITMCIAGTSRALYDMKEVSLQRNDMSLILPGHIVRPLECSDDFKQEWLIFDPSKYTDSELKFNENDLKYINQAPHCHVTDEQAHSLRSILTVIQYMLLRTEDELPSKHRLLETQLTLAYELYISIRHEQDQEWKKDRMGQLYMQFCDLVVAHYKEEREINYYARLLGYDARYFSKIFRAYNGISPLAWVQQYVATQAKRLIKEYPERSIKETAFQLGFASTANFCRYFKRVTGMTPQEYKGKNK